MLVFIGDTQNARRRQNRSNTSNPIHGMHENTPLSRSVNRDSIVAFGFTNPLLVSEDGELIAGHGRYEAAKLLDFAEVPVIVVAGLTKTTCPCHRRQQNRRKCKVGSQAPCKTNGNDNFARCGGTRYRCPWLQLIEIDRSLIVTMRNTPHLPDEIDPVNAISRPGDVWSSGEHKLICGDARSTADIDATIRRWQSFTRKNAIHAISRTEFLMRLRAITRHRGAISH